MQGIHNVTVFGYSNTPENDPTFKECFETCKLLAEKGFDIANGGGPGIMRASSMGAKAGNGKTIGVTFYPSHIDGKDNPNFEGRDEKNPLDQEIETKSYVERTLKLIELGDVFIFFNGGTGTLSEFGMAWGLAKIYLGHHKPLILYGEFWHAITEAIASNMLIRDDALKVYQIVTSPQEAVEAVIELNNHVRFL